MPTPPGPVKISHKKMAAEGARIYFMFPLMMDSQCLMFTSESKKDVKLCMTNVYLCVCLFFLNVLLRYNI